MVEMAAANLGEHFDGVLIIATREAGGRSTYHQSGSGSYYTWVGLATEFLNQDQMQTGEDEDDSE